MRPEEDINALSLPEGGKSLDRPPISGYVDEEYDEAANTQNNGINFAPILKAVRRNVLLVVGIAALTSGAAFYKTAKVPPLYGGNFRLQVEPLNSDARRTDPAAITQGNTSTEVMDYPTLLQVLQSPGMLAKVAKQVQVRYADVSNTEIAKGLTVQRLGTNLSDATKLVEVSYQGTDPKRVKFVLEQLAKEYLQYGLDNRKSNIKGGVRFIEEQLPQLQKKVDTLRGKIQLLEQRYALSDPNSERTALSERLRVTRDLKRQTQRELLEQQMLQATIQKQLAFNPSEAVSASTLTEDSTFQTLRSELAQVDRQIAIESSRLTDKHPTLLSLRAKRVELSQLLSRQAQQASGSTTINPRIIGFQNSTRQGLIRQMVETTNQKRVLAVRSRQLATTETVLSKQIKQLAVVTRQYSELQRQLEIAVRTLNTLSTQRETFRVESAQQETPWQLVAEPSIPYDAAGKPVPLPVKNSKTLMAGVIGGLALGLGAALLREKSRKVYLIPDDLQEVSAGLPLVKLSGEPEAKVKLPNSQAQRHRFTTKSEGTDFHSLRPSTSLNSIYTWTRFLASIPSVQSLVVSSAEAGDGKTTIALQLAEAAALSGQRVLLVDANLHQPQVHARLGLPNREGLSDLLAESPDLNTIECAAILRDYLSMSIARQSQEMTATGHELTRVDRPQYLVQRSPIDKNLFVLTAGHISSDTTKLLASGRMQLLIEQFQAIFDLVIYDTPHLHGLVDAQILTSYADGVLMVVQVGKTDRSKVKQVFKQLNADRLPVLGVVANQVDQIEFVTNSETMIEYSPLESKPTGSLANLKQPGRKDGKKKGFLWIQNKTPENALYSE
jgi:Mrp family chromosome partitioning ATPase/uncharacterized protein involved in exopolysaccharide biosynthesis